MKENDIDIGWDIKTNGLEWTELIFAYLQNMLNISKNSEKLGYFDFISSGVFVERFDSLSLSFVNSEKKRAQKFLEDGTHIICSRLVASTIQKNEKLIGGVPLPSPTAITVKL